MADTAPTVIVEEKPAFLSKVNWASVISVVFTMLAAFGLNIPDELKVQILAAVSAITGIVTVVLRTYFTTTITPTSAKKL